MNNEVFGKSNIKSETPESTEITSASADQYDNGTSAVAENKEKKTVKHHSYSSVGPTIAKHQSKMNAFAAAILTQQQEERRK